ncbi:MAG: glycosyltransferase family 4 protein [Vulcanimicrobiaceae bacterium]
MTTPLRIAVDARDLALDTRGIGRYARAVVRRMARRDDVDLTLLTTGPFAFRHRNALADAIDSDRFRVASRTRRDIEVIWHPANGTFFSCAAKNVVTIHDVVPFRYPDPDPQRRERQQAPFLRSARSAAHVIAVSAFGADEVHDVLAVPREKITVIHHGVEASFSPSLQPVLPQALAGRPYLLFVGDALGEPRKNFALLYEAVKQAWPAGDGPVLAVVGPGAPISDGIVQVGNVSEDLRAAGGSQLRSIYSGAIALCMASYHETFGMPAIEAMACGTPVVASAASCLPEVCAGAALYARPHDAADWAAKLRSIVADSALRQTLRAAGIERAKAFDWERSAAEHMRVFERVARQSAPG